MENKYEDFLKAIKFLRKQKLFQNKIEDNLGWRDRKISDIKNKIIKISDSDISELIEYYPETKQFFKLNLKAISEEFEMLGKNPDELLNLYKELFIEYEKLLEEHQRLKFYINKNKYDIF